MIDYEYILLAMDSLQNKPFSLPYLLCIIAYTLLLSSCSGTLRKTPVPEAYVDKVKPIGFTKIRYWGDNRKNKAYKGKLIASLSRNGPTKPIYILGISGGGSYGAFSAGILNGWTASGTRPNFNLVTGISTGALIAPFAFMGPSYDHLLKELYTTIDTDNVISFSFPLFKVISGSDAIGDSAPLKKLLKQYITRDFLDQLVKASKGRRSLLIGTTNLDARRLVIWDMVEIAKRPGKYPVKMFREIMLASASIPVAFPPVYVPVSYNRKKYYELHVDGGVMSSVFVTAGLIDPDEAAKALGWESLPPINIYVLRNNYMEPPYQPPKRNLFSIAGQSILTLTSNIGKADLLKIKVLSAHEKVNFKYINVPKTFEYVPEETFDQKEMQALYALGYKLSVKGVPWRVISVDEAS